MRRRVERAVLLGATMIGMLGCSAPAPTGPERETAAIGGFERPERLGWRDGGGDLRAQPTAFELQQRRGRRYRHRRIVIRGVPYYVPYFAYQSYYLPDYLRTDPSWYYVYAYTGPNFTGSRRMIRIRRDRDRDRDWNDRRDWNRGDGDDWRDDDRDERMGGRGGGFGDRFGDRMGRGR